jgi:hypothetical protein
VIDILVLSPAELYVLSKISLVTTSLRKYLQCGDVLRIFLHACHIGAENSIC